MAFCEFVLETYLKTHYIAKSLWMPQHHTCTSQSKTMGMNMESSGKAFLSFWRVVMGMCVHSATRASVMLRTDLRQGVLGCRQHFRSSPSGSVMLRSGFCAGVLPLQPFLGILSFSEGKLQCCSIQRHSVSYRQLCFQIYGNSLGKKHTWVMVKCLQAFGHIVYVTHKSKYTSQR